MTQTKRKSNRTLRHWPMIAAVMFIIGGYLLEETLAPSWLADFLKTNRLSVVIITVLFMLNIQFISYLREGKFKRDEIQAKVDNMLEPVRDISLGEIIETLLSGYANGKTRHDVELELFELARQDKIDVWGIPCAENSMLMMGSVHEKIPSEFFISCKFVDLAKLGLGAEQKLMLFNASRDLGNGHLVGKEYVNPEVSGRQVREIYEINS